MSIKYSEIFAADEVLSAGTDDIIVLAIVDGGSPTGFTSKAIKAGNLLNWQGVMDLGSSALDIVSDAILVTDEFKVDFKSKKDEDKEARLILNYFEKTELSFRDYIAGTNLIKIDETGFLVQDELALKGAFYAADYSANFVARSLVDKGYSDTNLGGSALNPIFITPSGFEEGFVPSWDDSAQEYTLLPNLNGIYTGDGTLSADTEVLFAGFDLTYTGTSFQKVIIEGNGNLILDGSLNEIQVGRSVLDATLPNGGVVIKPDSDLGNGSRFGTIRGVSGTAFDNDVTTFILTSDWEKGTIFELNQGGVLAGKFSSRVGGVVFDSGDLDILGNLKIVDGTEGNIGDVWTSTDALGNGAWAIPGGGAVDTLYTADGTIALDRTVTIADTKSLTFNSTNSSINEKAIRITNNAVVDETYFNKSGDMIMEYTGDAGHNAKRIIIGETLSAHAPSGILELSATVSGGYSIPKIIGRAGLTAAPDRKAYELTFEVFGQGALRLYRQGTLGGTLRGETGGLQIKDGNLGIGIAPSTTDILLTSGGDVNFRGFGDANLFKLDDTNDVISIGSTPSTNNKLKITSTNKWTGLYVTQSSTVITTPKGINAECTSASTTSSTAVYGIAAGSTGDNIALDGIAFQTTVGVGIGVRGTAIRVSTGHNYAGFFEGKNTGSGNGFGVYVKSGTSVFNSDLGNYDFQVNGDTFSGLIFADASQQNIGVNTITPNASSIIDFTSTTQGVLMPRMSGGQANLITPVDGLVVYITSAAAPFTQNGFWGYVNGAWLLMA